MPYQARRTDPVTYDVDLSAVVTAPAGARLLRVWLPIPPSDPAQEVEPGTFSTFPQEFKPRFTVEKEFSNRFAYFEFREPQGGQVIRHRFRVKVWELHWDLDPTKVRAVERWPAGFDRYRRGDRSLRVDDRFRTLAEQLTGSERGPTGRLDRLMDWLQERMRYDYTNAALDVDTTRSLETLKGNCADYHGLCASLGRSLGMPSRLTYGLHLFAKPSPAHCKLEVFLPPYGWVSFDVSETQKLVQALGRAPELDALARERLTHAAMERLRHGFRDNTWLLQTVGTDFELEPKASRRVSVVRTLYAEADGVPLPEPNPGDPTKREFAWMTVYKVTSDRAVVYPFRDWHSLEKQR